MLYSKTGKYYSHDFEFQQIKKLDEVDFSQPVTYYHHPYDKLQHGVSLYDCLDHKNWEFLRSNFEVKLIHDTNSETFEIYLVDDIVKTIRDRVFSPMQLKVIVMDENHKRFLETQLSKQGIKGVDISVDNYLLRSITIPTTTGTPFKKFSALSRNYRMWRLHVYAALQDIGLLDHFNYSFHNISPYVDNPVPETVSKMLVDLENTNFGEVSNSVSAWLKSCPHELQIPNNVRDKWSNVTYDTIQGADFHLLIETHYDQKEYVSNDKTYSRDFSPSSITEKAYKPIACATPFIAFATPNWLEDLRALGFKTYAPHINEDYDKEPDSNKRLNMIVKEIERICSLDDNSYTELVKNCKLIAEENLQILKKHKLNAQ
jgi:hypothetical protein